MDRESSRVQGDPPDVTGVILQVLRTAVLKDLGAGSTLILTGAFSRGCALKHGASDIDLVLVSNGQEHDLLTNTDRAHGLLKEALVELRDLGIRGIVSTDYHAESYMKSMQPSSQVNDPEIQVLDLLFFPTIDSFKLSMLHAEGPLYVKERVRHGLVEVDPSAQLPNIIHALERLENSIYSNYIEKSILAAEREIINSHLILSNIVPPERAVIEDAISRMKFSGIVAWNALIRLSEDRYSGSWSELASSHLEISDKVDSFKGVVEGFRSLLESGIVPSIEKVCEANRVGIQAIMAIKTRLFKLSPPPRDCRRIRSE